MFAARTRVLDKVQDLTGIKPGETDLELKFSLETVNCLGCCALGPVMESTAKTHGKTLAGQGGRRAEELRVGEDYGADKFA